MAKNTRTAHRAVLVFLAISKGVKELGTHKFLKKINRDDLLKPLSSVPDENAVKFLAEEMLILAYQETENSSPETFKAAQDLATELGGTFLHWNIDEAVGNYINIMEGKLGLTFNWKEHDIVLQNIQARSRSPMIWILANLKNYLLLVTSNRSEGSVGYATMDGDTSGSLAPIAGISKEFIQEWLRWAENEFNLGSLAKINALKPSAELRPLKSNQTDEEDVMPYTLLQQIEELAVEKKLSPVEVFKALEGSTGYAKKQVGEYIIRFYRMLSRSQWKRQRFAPTFHLDDYNLNPGSWFRFPVLSSSFEDEIRELDEIIRNSH